MRSVTIALSGGATSVVEIGDAASAAETRDTIQAALELAAGHPAGGTVTLSAGIFEVVAGLDAGEGALRVGSNTTFEGAGIGQTTIRLAGDPGHDVTGIVRTDSGKTNPDGTLQGTHGVLIRGLSIDGNRASTGSWAVDGFFSGPKPFTATAVDNNIRLENVEIYEVSRYGFDPHEQTINLVFVSCIAHDNGQDGFTIDYCSDVTITGCEAYENGRHGFNIVTSSHDVLLSNNSAHDNGSAGIVVQTGNFETRMLTANVVIEGGSVANNAQDGIVVRQSSNVSIGGPGLDEGVSITGNGRFGILVEGGLSVSIEGNAISGNNAGATGSDNAEIRVRGYAQTYLDADPFNDVFVASEAITITGNTLGSAGVPHTYGVSYSDAGTPLFSANTLTGIGALSVEDTSKRGSLPLFVEQITAGADIIAGTSGNDSITGDTGDDTILGGAGHDQLYGADGNDRLEGGAGNDILTGGFGDDTYLADAGDTIVETANGGSDRIDTALSAFSIALLVHVENLRFTGSGSFSGTGNGGANRIEGGSGNDVLDGGAGNDTLAGGAGNDTYILDSAGDTIEDSAGIDTVKADFTLTLAAGLERLVLLGTAEIDGSGNAAHNVLIGNGASNRLYGGAGDDTLDGREGADTLDGGLGNDVFVIDNVGDIILDAGGTDTIVTPFSTVLASGFEALILTGALAVSGTGNAVANAITGNGAANAIKGLGGNDRIWGGGGNDLIAGGAGRDTLTGGAGYDHFVFDAGLTSGADRITDFSVRFDTMRLENAVYTKLGGAGGLKSVQFYKGAAAHDADDRILYNPKTGAVTYDANGDGAGGARVIALLDKGLALTHADFLIV